MIGISTPQHLTWRDFSTFGAACSQLFILHYGKGWLQRTGDRQFEYWISSIWTAFHHDKFIRFVAAQQNTELNYIFDLADMLYQPIEEIQQ